jgi:dTDP-glucose 4,6-dehydratase
VKRVLIAGGSGFLGSHLCDRFLTDGWSVVCVDNLLTGRKTNIAHLEDREGFRFVEGDITEPFRGLEPQGPEKTDSKPAGPFDAVLNFASPASLPDFKRYPVETLRVGSAGTENLLEIARRDGAVFLQASTSEVYGDPEVSPQPESYPGRVNPVGPRSMYDEAKRYAEALVTAYRRRFGLATRIVRIFNTYGPRMRPDDGRVVPNFILQTLRREPFTIYGDGSQTRSFCYVSDLVEGIVRLLASDRTEPVNLGNPREVTVLDFARILHGVASPEAEFRVEYRELPGEDPKVRRPDVTQAKAVLGWEPVVDLEDGLKRTVDSFRDRESIGIPDSSQRDGTD